MKLLKPILGLSTFLASLGRAVSNIPRIQDIGDILDKLREMDGYTFDPYGSYDIQSKFIDNGLGGCGINASDEDPRAILGASILNSDSPFDEEIPEFSFNYEIYGHYCNEDNCTTRVKIFEHSTLQYGGRFEKSDKNYTYTEGVRNGMPITHVFESGMSSLKLVKTTEDSLDERRKGLEEGDTGLVVRIADDGERFISSSIHGHTKKKLAP